MAQRQTNKLGTEVCIGKADQGQLVGPFKKPDIVGVPELGSIHV